MATYCYGGSMSFQKMTIKRKYKSSTEVISADFYNPVLDKSIQYNRAVGYFSSKVFLDYIAGLENFIANDGQMKLIISPFITHTDALAFLEMSNEDKIFTLDDNIYQLFLNYKNGEIEENISTKIMLLLIKKGFLTIKLAIPKTKTGIFHEKIGVFIDKFGNKIAINGSNNETYNAMNSNIESFNTFCSWITGQAEYVYDHETDFDNYWNNEDIEVSTLDLSEGLKNKLFKEINTGDNFSDLYDELKKRNKNIQEPKKSKVIPYPFQKMAVDKWLLNKTGIFKFATGSGKTKTAIHLIDRLIELEKRLIVVIGVPDKTLIVQWTQVLSESGYDSIPCYSDNTKWQIQVKDAIDEFKFGISDCKIIIVTKDSFSELKFQQQLKKISTNALFIADECHRFGTENLLSKLPSNIKYRLGLSATPEVYFSQNRTDRLFDYFGGVCAEYDLESAISDGFLVPYSYYPIRVKLSDAELIKYNKLSRQIGAYLGGKDEKKIKEIDQDLEKLLFKRARIIYSASDKINVLANIIDDLAEQGHLLVYCGATSATENILEEEINDSMTQLERVNDLLFKKNIKSAQYTQDESGHVRLMSIDAFKSGMLSTLVAIKCLDEGVDIPEIEQAVILASSGNPREFIQRRGRLLRLNPPVKTKAKIYDLVVIEDDVDYETINKNELTRVYEFSRIALNSDDVYIEYRDYFDKYLWKDETND